MKSYTVIYRTGGTENFQWKKCLPVATREKAFQDKAEIERMGYKSIVHDTDQINAIGLPETYDASQPVIQ